VSLVIFIIAWVFIMVLSFGFPYNGTTHEGIVAVFSLFPWSLLSKGLLDLANATTGEQLLQSKGECRDIEENKKHVDRQRKNSLHAGCNSLMHISYSCIQEALEILYGCNFRKKRVNVHLAAVT
jgi:hypothetical protein